MTVKDEESDEIAVCEDSRLGLPKKFVGEEGSGHKSTIS
jgi:hypothetical protein